MRRGGNREGGFGRPHRIKWVPRPYGQEKTTFGITTRSVWYYPMWYVVNVLLSLDQTLNSLLLGDPDDSISGRLGRLERDGDKIACVLCRWMSRLYKEPAHCLNAILEMPMREIWTWDRTTRRKLREARQRLSRLPSN